MSILEILLTLYGDQALVYEKGAVRDVFCIREVRIVTSTGKILNSRNLPADRQNVLNSRKEGKNVSFLVTAICSDIWDYVDEKLFFIPST